MKIYEKKFLAECTEVFFAIFLVLAVFMLSGVGLRLLQQAGKEGFGTPELLVLLVLYGMRFVPILLSGAALTALALVWDRMRQDREILAWISSGLGLWGFARPVIFFSIPIILGVGALSFFFAPWATRKMDKFRLEIVKEAQKKIMTPGVFTPLPGGGYFFIERSDLKNFTFSGAFYADEDKGVDTVLWARDGIAQLLGDGSMSIEFYAGNRYDFKDQEIRELSFSGYRTLMPPPRIVTKGPGVDRKPLAELFKERNASAFSEILRRASQPLSFFIVALFTVGAMPFDPKANRAFYILTTLLLYFFYFNLQNVAFALGLRGEIHPLWSFGVLHAAMALFVAGLFWHRKAFFFQERH